MKNWIKRTPLALFILLALTLGLAPFAPEPHIVEKLRMLADGSLSRPIDIFDLVLHGTPWVLLVTKVIMQTKSKDEPE
ncbi:MAG: RND transporter [Gammaproteobacteria bacterium]|nr:RND transporter [Gammaproteobacteria bacterium]